MKGPVTLSYLIFSQLSQDVTVASSNLHVLVQFDLNYVLHDFTIIPRVGFRLVQIE